MEMDINLIIAFAIAIAMAMVHFGIQIYKALKKEDPPTVVPEGVSLNPGNEILIELTKTSEGVKNLGKNFTEYKEDNNKAHDKIFDLINKILLKKGG